MHAEPHRRKYNRKDKQFLSGKTHSTWVLSLKWDLLPEIPGWHFPIGKLFINSRRTMGTLKITINSLKKAKACPITQALPAPTALSSALHGTVPSSLHGTDWWILFYLLISEATFIKKEILIKALHTKWEPEILFCLTYHGWFWGKRKMKQK